MSLSINPFTTDPASPDSSSSAGQRASSVAPQIVSCPSCGGGIAITATSTEWQSCAHCDKSLQIRVWPAVRQNNNAATALSDQATCFFHPEKAFQACCQRCGRFVCALCDLQLGAEHVCPTCFERGRGDPGAAVSHAEWRYRDVLYDSIALTIGWAWILFWPTFVVTLPAAIFLHVKYRKAPLSYLIPRSGWRFWVAYVGFIWLPLLLAGLFVPLARRH